MTPAELLKSYQALKKLAAPNLPHPAIGAAVTDLAVGALTFLTAEAERQALTSAVAGKDYFSFRRGDRLSRPIERALFIDQPDLLRTAAQEFTSDGLRTITAGEANRLIYSLAMAFCAAIDVIKDRDKQTPATYFAHLIAHVFATTFDVHPQTEIEVLVLGDERSMLPTDYIFDLGAGRSKLHLPVKTSTRERVIQAWAHQRVLDGVYGVTTIRGVLVVLTETKLDRTSLVVTEICLPEQWGVYQRFIAQMYRVYYLDAPAAYLALSPLIVVKPLGEMFAERDQLAGVAPGAGSAAV